MKFGEHLESESVPEWSLHNIDYNNLKQFIKVHTTRDQATAIPIPGQKDTALHRFENDFYDELYLQHDRVGLFVATKSDEINRRLQHLSDQIHRLLIRSSVAAHGTAALKRQRRFAKYDRAALQLQDEIRDLSRFVNVQREAFRKILKKYRKWTGSSSLGSRFKENVLSDPKSFTRRDFTHLETQCDELLATIRESTPLSSSPATPTAELGSSPESTFRRPSQGQIYSSSSSTLQALSSSAGSVPIRPRAPSDAPRRVTLLATAPVQTHYWNEYDDGSEAGDVGPGNGSYAIYLHPDEEADFPGMAALVSFFTVPYEKAKKWMAARGAGAKKTAGGHENDPLLSRSQGYGATYGAATAPQGAEDGGESGLFEPLAQQRQSRSGDEPEDGNEGEGNAHGEVAVAHADAGYDHDDPDDHDSTEGDDAFASDNEVFPMGYEAHYAALPSINDQRIARYRETVLARATAGCFVAALVLLGVVGILISTGRHRLRVEVDVGVILGVMASLGFACAALGMSMARHDRLPLWSQLAVWGAFALVCVLNGVMLVLVMGNAVVNAS